MTSTVPYRPDHNPYSPNSLQCDIRVPADGLPKLLVLIAAPVLGALIGIVHVGTIAMVWAYHGFPYFFFRSTEWAFAGRFLMAFGGGLFGVAMTTRESTDTNRQAIAKGLGRLKATLHPVWVGAYGQPS